MKAFYVNEVLTVESGTLEGAGIDNVVLGAQVNCEGEVSSYTVPSYNTGSFVADLNELFGAASIPQGVISLILTISYTNETVVKEYVCLFVEGTLVCDIADCIQVTRDVELQLDFYLLSRSIADGGCGCECDNLCVIYKRLLDGIENCKSC